jgi:hypothetical protein
MLIHADHVRPVPDNEALSRQRTTNTHARDSTTVSGNRASGVVPWLAPCDRAAIGCTRDHLEQKRHHHVDTGPAHPRRDPAGAQSGETLMS